MEFLDAFQYILDSLEILHAGEKTQVPKERIQDIKVYLGSIMTLLGKYMKNSSLRMDVARAMEAISAIESMNCVFISDEVKGVLTGALKAIEAVIADMAYTYFTVHDFDEDCEEDVEIITKIIKVKRGLM